MSHEIRAFKKFLISVVELLNNLILKVENGEKIIEFGSFLI